MDGRVSVSLRLSCEIGLDSVKAWSVILEFDDSKEAKGCVEPVVPSPI